MAAPPSAAGEAVDRVEDEGRDPRPAGVRLEGAGRGEIGNSAVRDSTSAGMEGLIEGGVDSKG